VQFRISVIYVHGYYENVTLFFTFFKKFFSAPTFGRQEYTVNFDAGVKSIFLRLEWEGDIVSSELACGELVEPVELIPLVRIRCMTDKGYWVFLSQNQ